MRFLELKVPPPVVALLVGTAMWYLAPLGPVMGMSSSAKLTVAIVWAVIGGGFALAGEIAFKRARTSINPLRPDRASSLVSSGIYRLTRNPMYVGLCLILLGWAIYLGSLLGFVGPIVFVLYVNYFQIVPEERILLVKFGPAYEEYLSRVRRWL